MEDQEKKIRELEDAAYAPYERIKNPTAEDWAKAYDALKELKSGMKQRTAPGDHGGGSADKWEMFISRCSSRIRRLPSEPPRPACPCGCP